MTQTTEQTQLTSLVYAAQVWHNGTEYYIPLVLQFPYGNLEEVAELRPREAVEGMTQEGIQAFYYTLGRFAKAIEGGEERQWLLRANWEAGTVRVRTLSYCAEPDTAKGLWFGMDLHAARTEEAIRRHILG